MSYKPHAISDSRLTSGPIADADSAKDAIRRDHLNTEANLQSIGFLFLIGSALTLLGAAGTWATSAARGASVVVSIAETGLIFTLAMVQGAIGMGLRRLRDWARWCALVLALPGLLAFPLGTLIFGIIIGSLLTKKANIVFSAEYRSIIQATPHIRYVSPWMLRVIGFAVLFLIALAAARMVLDAVTE
jgi:hypothetical protein